MADNDRGQSLITKYVWVTDSSSKLASALCAPLKGCTEGHQESRGRVIDLFPQR